MEKIKSYLPIVSFVVLVLLLFRSCGTGSDVNRLKKEVQELKSNTITKQEMVKLINETPAWKNLEIEELSDKNHVPINFYKNQNLVDTTN
jgi:hypothetical protein